MDYRRDTTRLHVPHLPGRLHANVPCRQIFRLQAFILLPNRHPAIYRPRTGGFRTNMSGLLTKIKNELRQPTFDSYNIIVSLLYYLLATLNRAYATAYNLPAAMPKNNYAFRFKALLEQHIREVQRVEEYADMMPDKPCDAQPCRLGSVRRHGQPPAQATSSRSAQERLPVRRPQRNPTCRRLPFLGSEPLMRFFKQQTGKDLLEYQR